MTSSNLCKYTSDTFSHYPTNCKPYTRRPFSKFTEPDREHCSESHLGTALRPKLLLTCLSATATVDMTGSFPRNHRNNHRYVRSAEDEVVPKPLQIVKRSVSSSTTDKSYQPPSATRYDSAGSFKSDASMDSMPEPPGRNTSLAVPKTRENKALEHASTSTASLLEGYEHCQPVITVNTFQSNRK